jgi:hypothetical protein
VKIIEIIVAPDGQARIETKGFSGAECRQASDFLEKALGQRTADAATSEFYQQAAQQQGVREGG